jgi:peroxidase
MKSEDLLMQLGGRTYTVPLGRRDSTTASLSQANTDLPPPTFDLANLTSAFAAKGLSRTDMVALSGTYVLDYQLLCVCLNFTKH